MTRPTVGCLIPAYNEAARIGGVLAALRTHPLIDRVLVVDDGSSDATAAIALAQGVEVLRLATNRGKTAAVAEGIAALSCDLLLLLDSDLTGLVAADVSALLSPVLRGEADVALSLRGNAPLVWRLIGLDYISGERVLPRAMLARRLDQLHALPRFGLEAHMNALWVARGCRVAVCRWPGVASPAKSRKRGMIGGLRADIAMLRDIFRTISPLAALQQIVRLRQQAEPAPRHASVAYSR